MPISAIKYPSINAKLKAMYSRRLKKSDLIDLCKQNNLMSVIAILKNKNTNMKKLDENADRQDVEKALNYEIILDLEKIVKYLDKKDSIIFQILISKYEMNCIKKSIELIFSKNQIDYTISVWTENIFKNLKGIEHVANLNDLMKLVENTKYKKIIEKYIDENNINFSIFKIENELDKLYFKNIFDTANNKELKNIIGTQIDFTNIMWIYRMKMYYNFSEEFIRSVLIDVNYKLSKNEINQLILANNFEELNDIIRKTKYSSIISDNMFDFECFINKYLHKAYEKMFRLNFLSINCIYAYLNLVEIENNEIISIVESVRYNIDKSKVLKKII